MSDLHTKPPQISDFIDPENPPSLAPITPREFEGATPDPEYLDATYSAEDNKLRLYPLRRFDADTLAIVKAFGFRWAPKQALFVKPKWTPKAEDLCLYLAGTIEAEPTTLIERAEIKADRLEGYAENRARDADAFYKAAQDLSRRFEGGQPILIGHHSEGKAQRDQAKMHRAMEKSVQARQAIDYWGYRVGGVVSHANRKNNPKVRARRIKTLLKDLRRIQRGINKAEQAFDLWRQVKTDDGIKALAGQSDFAPWQSWGRLDRGEIDAQSLKSELIAHYRAAMTSKTRRRWLIHILNRLAYERSFFAPPALFEGTLTPVILQAFARENGAAKPVVTDVMTDIGPCYKMRSHVTLPLHIHNGTELTLKMDDWRVLMQSCGYSVPAHKPRRKSTSIKMATPLLNPSLEEAERLQAVWNARMAEKLKDRPHQAAKTEQVTQFSQKQYSQLSGGTYALCKTMELTKNGRVIKNGWIDGKFQPDGQPAFRLRINTSRADFHKPYSIVHLSDKPRKPLPLDWDLIEGASS